MDIKREAATTVVMAWLKANNQAMKTLDPTPVLELSTPDCESCKVLADGMREAKRKGERYEGEFVEQFRGIDYSLDETPPVVTIKVGTGDWKYVDKSGKAIKTYKASKYDRRFVLRWRGGKWLIAESGQVVDK